MGWLNKLFGGSQKTDTMTKESSRTKGAAEVKTTVKDPVCGMMIDPKTAAGKSDYVGKTYYFCNPGCKKTFDANPAKYAAGGATKPISGG